jgi:hypothetical protein
LNGASAEELAKMNFVPDADAYRADEYIVARVCDVGSIVHDWQLAAQNFGDVVVNALVDAVNRRAEFKGYCQPIAAKACVSLGSFVDRFVGRIERRGGCKLFTTRRWQAAEAVSEGRDEIVLMGRILFVCIDATGEIMYCENNPIVMRFDTGLTVTTDANVPLGRDVSSECLAVILADDLELRGALGFDLRAQSAN